MNQIQIGKYIVILMKETFGFQYDDGSWSCENSVLIFDITCPFNDRKTSEWSLENPPSNSDAHELVLRENFKCTILENLAPVFRSFDFNNLDLISKIEKIIDDKNWNAIEKLLPIC